MAYFLNNFGESPLNSQLTSLLSLKSFSLLNQERLNNNYLFSCIANHLIVYLIPIAVTYAWSFGFLAYMWSKASRNAGLIVVYGNLC